jgi:hypothetical protein
MLWSLKMTQPYLLQFCGRRTSLNRALQRQHRRYATLSGTLASLTQQFSCFRHGGQASLRTLIRHGVSCVSCCERRSSESGHAHGNRAKSIALLARVPDLRYRAPIPYWTFFHRPRIAHRTTRGNSTCKMREFTGLNIFLFPLALERILKVQCDVGEFKLQQKPSYPRRFFSRVETRVDVWVSWRSNGRKGTSRVRDLSLGGLFVARQQSQQRWVRRSNLIFLSRRDR